jgi:LacI family transcriptional regulator
MVTIKDVAKMAGVSTATVSRILNDDKTYKASNETRNRVWNVVSELGYIPNQAAKYLSKQGNTNRRYLENNIKIGCILCVTKEKYADPYFMTILSGVESKLMESGYNLSVVRTYSELQERTILFNTLSESLTGMILMETLSDDIYKAVKDKVNHIVGIDTLHPEIDNVCYDRFEAAEKAVNHLIQKGHRRIAFLGGADLTGNIRKEKRYKGYLNALEDAGINEDLSIVKNCEWDSKLCYEYALELIDNPKRPTAIFAASDIMGIIAMNAIYERNLKVPDDIAVMGLSNIEMSMYANPSLSTIDVPKKEMGEAAAEILISRIKGDTSLPKRIILPTNLIIRNSI